MDTKKDLRGLFFLMACGVFLSILTMIMPLITLNGLLVTMPFVAMGIAFRRLKAKTTVMATIACIIIFVSVRNMTAMNIILTQIVPAYLMGVAIGFTGVSKTKEPFYVKGIRPIMLGILLFFAGLVAVYMINKLVFSNDMLKTVSENMRTILSMRPNILETTVDDYVSNMMTIIPSVAIVISIILAVVAYYLGIRMYARVFKEGVGFLPFRFFMLPGSALVMTILLYVFTFAMGMIFKELKADAILLNLEIVFGGLFAVQGLSVIVFLAIKWVREKLSKRVALLIFGVIFLGTFMISMLGMWDCAFDLRKMRQGRMFFK